MFVDSSWEKSTTVWQTVCTLWRVLCCSSSTAWKLLFNSLWYATAVVSLCCFSSLMLLVGKKSRSSHQKIANGDFLRIWTNLWWTWKKMILKSRACNYVMCVTCVCLCEYMCVCVCVCMCACVCVCVCWFLQCIVVVALASSRWSILCNSHVPADQSSFLVVLWKMLANRSVLRQLVE